ncbi:MAG: response regulator transcription factor [Gammaproteobacteria bacterium]|nr:response regulator transcription factor [Gammaproteobacteria bacterium]
MRFLLVEDNVELGNAITERLGLEGHIVDWATTLGEANTFITSTQYQVALIDMTLPDGDGKTLLQTLRRSGEPAQSETPIIILTARSTVSDRVDSLDSGADDYLVKPFEFEELLARCRAVIRRKQGRVQNAAQFGDLSFDAQTASLWIGDVPISLRNRERRLMEAFFDAPGRTLSKQHLHDRLFSFDDDASDNAIEVYVARLRKKLGQSDVTIETQRGVGYRLVTR